VPQTERAAQRKTGAQDRTHFIRGIFDRHVIIRRHDGAKLEGVFAAPEGMPLDDSPRGIGAAQLEPRCGKRRRKADERGDQNDFNTIFSFRVSPVFSSLSRSFF
jgi:hypothetical protein